jgi:hypothetical protein
MGRQDNKRQQIPVCRQAGLRTSAKAGCRACLPAGRLKPGATKAEAKAKETTAPFFSYL